MIFIPKSSIQRGSHGVAINTKIMFRGYEISIAMDDSCGNLQDIIARASVSIFNESKNVTEEITGRGSEIHRVSGEDLFEIMKQIDALPRS